jgi:hypothetical protein
MATLILPGLAAAPPVAPGAGPCTLAEVERETAARLGPFWAFTASGGTADTVTVAELRTTAPLGGYEGLYLLRREATQATDRGRTVDRVDGTSGGLVVDFPYTGPAAAGEVVELHHLHPDLQLLVDVHAGLRRCYLLDTLLVDAPVAVAPPGGYPGAVATVLDLTAQAFWLTSPRQVLAVTSGGALVPAAGRYGSPSSNGWTCWASRGTLYLGVPGGVPTDGLTVRAYRDACGLVNGADAPDGPLLDDDLLSVPLDYAAALAHIEAWRRHRDRLEAAAAEGRFPTQEEAAAEATRCASRYASWLFQPQQERGDRVASPWGTGSSSSGSGLGGTGALQGAVVNQNDPYGAW